MYLIRRLFSWRISSPVLSGLCRSFMWMLLGAIVLSLLLWGSGMKEQDLAMYTYIVHGIAAAFGGLTAGRRASSKGWYQGALTGGFYGVIVLLVGFLALDSSPAGIDGLWVLAAAAIGALGGIFGVNLQKP
ncbi:MULTISPECIES: TIGR04086 family membrane protein [unclassified Paenibacillus]|uniref:TIGR04086 family membrane protein n=1 Tax=unclassified Paenibacillus TaxID=185978 RepID=UPI002406458C|nr:MULTISPECIES: TIGR04086 family membrane protein [unclassified Paenibacillus]MDF9843926.1 putative membrane protein (TIGR04086 family) [Paenibacillus sp. PastF-2]MDF9850531.1 putative membrane protein (TIGR04086 family) [Paenibacillus sp. PastM-2]MDF9856257.1 putative membrane protein (TIGR04086 family) [Paenibacillus sp. PastF-1]MDH6481514.1 putative membrane protein (TIGR04086 family) [Paenibacillus sp. PastH-2]MDH6509828.1 putative membrane protein (TIGR04086 family) [Paenibacillus sp. Pa